MGRAIAIAGELGNDAVATYETVKDPSSAAVNIVGMLLGVGPLAKVARDGKGLSRVAAIRRRMTSDEIGSLGQVFKDQDERLQNLLRKECL